MFDEIKKRVEKYKRESHALFSGTAFHYDDIPDSHSVAIVCSHQGLPLFDIVPGKYEVHNETPQVNDEPLDRYKKAIAQVVDKL